MIVRSEPASAKGLPDGTACGVTSTVGAGFLSTNAPPTHPLPGSEVPSLSSPGTPSPPCDDPARVRLLEELVAEREPSLDSLLRERDPWPQLYTPLSRMLEAQTEKFLRDWRRSQKYK